MATAENPLALGGFEAVLPFALVSDKVTATGGWNAQRLRVKLCRWLQHQESLQHADTSELLPGYMCGVAVWAAFGGGGVVWLCQEGGLMMGQKSI